MGIEKLNCNLCGSNNYTVVYENRDRERISTEDNAKYLVSEAEIQKPEKLIKCNHCGLISAEQDENVKGYADKYAEMVDEEYQKEELGRRQALANIVKKIEKFKKGGKLLDVGCACGFLMDEAKKRNWDVCGVEVSRWAAEHAFNHLNLNVINNSLEGAAFQDHSFDVIVMIDLLEHLIDPKRTLIEARRILKDDGLLCISTPNISSLMSRILGARWWGINKYHLYYFSKNTLDKMLDACGFKAKKYNSHIRIFSLNYWAKRIKVHNRILFKSLDFISRINNLGQKHLKIGLHDQIEVLAAKERKLDFLVSSIVAKDEKAVKKDMKVFAVLPAFNAEKNLKRTVDDIPKDIVNKIILVDDKSTDRTVEIAKELGLEVYCHEKNMGYGANQKTCYQKALEQGADIVVMVHPDYQYDPTVIPSLVEPIMNARADAVFGSRMMKCGSLEGGMPLWKHNVNILLTAFENIVLGTYLTEYHSGFRAYSADVLKTVNFDLNSNKFVFDTEIIVQLLLHHFQIEEVPIQTRYFAEASKIKVFPRIIYGLDIIRTMAKYFLHIKGIYKFRQFE